MRAILNVALCDVLGCQVSWPTVSLFQDGLVLGLLVLQAWS